MELNADFTQRVVIHSSELEWQESPMPGVSRRMLDRIGDEVARATTIVKYAPNSQFSPHTHTGGEEFIVLDGVFQDEHGDFPAGSYIRNPPESRHTPGSKPGCVIFVKLWQFDPNDRTHIRAHIDKQGRVPDAERTGAHVTPLYQDDREKVCIEYWEANTEIMVNTSVGGAEILVLDGSFQEGSDTLNTYSWLRVPKGYQLKAKAGSQGTRLWVKTEHLRFVAPPAQQ